MQEAAERSQGQEEHGGLAWLHQAIEEAGKAGCGCLLCRARPYIAAGALAGGGAAFAYGASREPLAGAVLAAGLGVFAILFGAYALGLSLAREARRAAQLRATALMIANHLHGLLEQRGEIIRDQQGHIEQHHAELQELSQQLATKLGRGWKPARLPNAGN